MTYVSPAARRKAAAKGQAMPGGRFPIRNASDLANAKQAIGRSKTPGATRAFINKRARELGEPPIGGAKKKAKRALHHALRKVK